MGMFIPEDQFYNEYDRQVGFNRYKQLIGRNWNEWIQINLLTLLGTVPLAFGIITSLLNSSFLLLIPCSFIGGMIWGPFLAGIIDCMLRCMRDDPMPWFSNYKKSWRQNWKGSLIPGGFAGLILGIFCFAGMLLWVAEGKVSWVSVLILLFSGLLFIVVFQLYFTQLVLFDQPAVIRLRNIILFILLNFRRTFLAGLLQILYWAIYFMFAPWTLLLLPFIGIWYILFVSEFLLYDRLNEAFHIEELIQAAAEENLNEDKNEV